MAAHCFFFHKIKKTTQMTHFICWMNKNQLVPLPIYFFHALKIILWAWYFQTPKKKEQCILSKTIQMATKFKFTRTHYM